MFRNTLKMALQKDFAYQPMELVKMKKVQK